MVLCETNFFSYLNNLNCFEKNPNVAVGVSGGPDSMALVYLVNKWIIYRKGKLSALVFDHGMRIESEKESHEVSNMLSELNIESTIIKTKTKPIKKNMEYARNNRFEGLISFCKKNNILHLFLGHHLDDNIETYLIRKINGSNFEGLSAMDEITYLNNIQILRPLIKINKKSILTFNKNNKIVYINDPSNNDTNFTRVKVRKFLQNNKYKTLAKKDFVNIKTELPHYKKMIWELMMTTLIDVGPKTIKVNTNKLLKLDDLILEKIILLFLKFFSNQKYKARSIKINRFMKDLKKSSFKIFNLSGITIKKNDEILEFSEK